MGTAVEQKVPTEMFSVEPADRPRRNFSVVPGVLAQQKANRVITPENGAGVARDMLAIKQGKKFMSVGVILLAEDNETDVLLTRRAFAKANLLNPLHVVSDGEEAIAYLAGEGKYSNRDEYPLPDLLLPDLKIPKKNGLEVLQWVRAQPGLCGLRIVVLTTSDQARDVNSAYQLGANSFLVKPVDFEHFVQISYVLKGYWMWMSKTPELSRPARATERRNSGTSNASAQD